MKHQNTEAKFVLDWIAYQLNPSRSNLSQMCVSANAWMIEKLNATPQTGRSSRSRLARSSGR